MPYKCLQSFLNSLEKEGELKRISQVVSPLVEINQFVQQEVTKISPTSSSEAKQFDSGREQIGGQALLFEQVEGCDFHSLLMSLVRITEWSKRLADVGLNQLLQRLLR